MLSLSLEEFMIELKDGSIKNVGPATKGAEAKLFDVSSARAREFGDKRVKLVFEDGEGNAVEVALFPEEAQKIRDDIESLEDGSAVFG